MKCKATRHGDQKICYECRLNWDHNDSDPPTCRVDELRVVPLPEKQVFFARLREQLIAGDHSIDMGE